MFLNEYPNDDIRKHSRRLDGYKEHKKRRSSKAMPEIVPLSSSDSDDEDVAVIVKPPNFSDISSDSWSSSSDDN